MESVEEAAREYRLTLAELRSNNKTQINLLTILADDYKEAAEQIVDVIEAHIMTVPPPQKLTVMYVCDSILKNAKKPNDYDKLFARKIVNMFEHVFRLGDERVRTALYKLRVTWASSSLFMPSKLYALDMKINQLDSAWPISNPRTGRALRDDPSVAAPPPPQTPPVTNAAPRVFVNPKFIDGKRTADKTPKSAPKPPASTSTAAKPPKKETKVDPLFRDKLLPSSSKTSSSPAGSKRKAAPAEHSNAPIRKKTQTPTADEDLRVIPRPKPAAPMPQDQDLRPRSLKPTSVVGSHAFAPPTRPPPPPSSNPPPFRHNSPPQDPAPAQKHVYASEQPKLDVPANNRIFVDGKAYEVMFVDDTAVIERGGTPHRIYFSGPPRNLIIDGIPHLLPFDTPTAIDILGAKHIVKFGAPSRELYIGGHPFKGQFGGPPIVATINGRRHEIRLSGSAPEVKIEPEPAYHLTRFLHKMREEKKIEITAEKPKDTGDWLAYLKNLQKTGVLPPVKPSSPRHQTPPPSQTSGANNSSRGGPNRRPNQQPMWSAKPTMMPDGGATGVEKKHAPPAAITDFNIRLLQIRYDSVVKTLTTKRADACQFCGMRIEGAQDRSKEWNDHMDWHVRQNLARSDTNSGAAAATAYRMWYPTATNWLTARASEQPKNEVESGAKDEPLPGVASSGVKSKECSVCQEKFDEYYDDDEEKWRLRDTVNVHGKVVHAACSADASLMDTPNTTFTENPFLLIADAVKTETLDEDVKDVKKDIITSSFEQQNALSTR